MLKLIIYVLEIVETQDQVSYGQCKNLAEFHFMKKALQVQFEVFRFLHIRSHINTKRKKNKHFIASVSHNYYI